MGWQADLLSVTLDRRMGARSHRRRQDLARGDEMTTDAVIRDMDNEDAEQVIAVWHASGVVRPWNEPARHIAFARRDSHSTVLVADLSGRISGRIVAAAMVGEAGHPGWVYYVATDPNDRGLGFGRAMMGAAGKCLANRGVWKLSSSGRTTSRSSSSTRTLGTATSDPPARRRAWSRPKLNSCFGRNRFFRTVPPQRLPGGGGTPPCNLSKPVCTGTTHAPTSLRRMP